MPQRNEKLKQFVNDHETAKAVHGLLLRIFLRPPKNRDVQTLAAAWMAKDLLEDAWTELLLYKGDEVEPKAATNIGV